MPVAIFLDLLNNSNTIFFLWEIKTYTDFQQRNSFIISESEHGVENRVEKQVGCVSGLQKVSVYEFVVMVLQLLKKNQSQKII